MRRQLDISTAKRHRCDYCRRQRATAHMKPLHTISGNGRDLSWICSDTKECKKVRNGL